MHEGVCTGDVMHLTCTVGAGVDSHVGSAGRRSPHMCRERVGGPQACRRDTALPPNKTVRQALPACNVSSYSES